jgi:hypothetical protein
MPLATKLPPPTAERRRAATCARCVVTATSGIRRRRIELGARGGRRGERGSRGVAYHEAGHQAAAFMLRRPA